MYNTTLKTAENMFWGLVLKANRKYTQTIKKGFHLSQAALDVTGGSDEPVQLVLSSEGHNYILCTLRKNKIEQVALDLNFAEGDEISFTSQGNGNVHLSGYLIPEQDDDLDFLEEDDSETEEQTPNVKGKKRKQEKEANEVSAKKINQAEDEDEDDSDFEESGEEDEGDDAEEDGEEEEESSSEEEVTEPKPKQLKLDKGKQNGLENGKVVSKEKQKKDKNKKQQQQQQQEVKTPKGGERTIQGGVKIEDIRVGNGPEAKPGKKVQVYYEGRLKSNNKVFDSSKQGNGFKFGLGRGEVIKGWDIGVAGMKVGGKRRITCPPHVAYGAKGSPPVIPPNSTLVFEVELKGVN